MNRPPICRSTLSSERFISRIFFAKKQETRNKKQETRNKKQETRNKKQETRNKKQEMFSYRFWACAIFALGLFSGFVGCTREEAEQLDYSLLPALIGKAELGGTLEVAIRREPPVGWEKLVRWYRDGAEIKGVKGVSYSLVSADLGKRIKASIEYVSDEGSGQLSYTKETEEVAWAPSTPYFEGMLEVDSVIQAVVDESFLSDWKHTVEWYSYSSGDAGTLVATTEKLPHSYKVKASDLDKRFRVKVLYAKGDAKKEVFSEYSPVVHFGQGRPVIEGVAVLDSMLRLRLQVSPSGWVRKVKWYRGKDGGYSEISGATGVSYKLGIADGGSQLRAGVLYEVSYKDGGATKRYMTKELYSDPTSEVRFIYLNLPVIEGVPEVGSELRVESVALDGWEVSYEWQRGLGEDDSKYVRVAGSSGQSLKLRHRDIGYQFRVRLAFTNKLQRTIVERFYSKPTSLVTWVRDHPLLLYGLQKESGKSREKSLFDTTLYVSSESAPLGWEREVRWYRKADGRGEAFIKSGVLARDTLYVLAGEDIGTRVRAGVLYRLGRSKTQELYTDYTESVSLSQLPPSKPTLTVIGGGEEEFGEVLEVGVDALPLPAGWSWEIRWLRVEPGVGRVVIAGATEKRYVIKYEDIGKQLLSEVRYVKGLARTSGTRTDVTSLIGKGIDLPASKPVILGDAKLGELLVGSNFDKAPGSGDWELKYRWYRSAKKEGGKDTLIMGSEAKSYRLVDKDVRNYIKVGQYF